MNGAISPRSLYAFMAYIRTASSVTLFPAKSHFIAAACLLISVGVNVTPLNAFMGPMVSLTILTMEMKAKSYVKLDEGGSGVFWEPQKLPVRLQLWIICFFHSLRSSSRPLCAQYDMQTAGVHMVSFTPFHGIEALSPSFPTAVKH
jgi:hypothetical protein